ncbi:C40 family peptidase [Lentibacillus amyloliquefaciens]|uniref:Cell wall-binding protein n=1 Tax=Lentibacillus amyloliquefaciens TaxID=1472767 RepID=A0A0U3W5T3_9BACI|nr:NlpC/P60 family protein [Lentibacillus amyloliquefaciens]ALX48528.1 cell wall-binding protein [Lentibacillus amyloliquefaciens]
MTKLNHPIRTSVVSTALVASLAFTPALGENVSAKANASSSDAGSSVEASETSLLKQGDRSEAVESVQSELASQGYYTYNLDGIYGPITKDAVEDFQSDNGLAVDGIVGPETKGALSLSGDQTEAKSETETQPETMNLNSTSSGSPSDSDVVATAESLIGESYTFGGETPSEGFDSSGFINYVFEQNGINLSREHADMWTSDGEHVDSPSVGDVVFFEATYDKEGASHSGIYIGNNQMIHAGTEETGVEVADMNIDYWQDRYLGAKSFD